MRQRVYNMFSIISTSENITEHQIISLYRQLESLFKSASQVFVSYNQEKLISGII